MLARTASRSSSICTPRRSSSLKILPFPAAFCVDATAGRAKRWCHLPERTAAAFQPREAVGAKLFVPLLSTQTVLASASRRELSQEVGVKFQQDIHDMTEKYMEAKDFLQDARESLGTTYFPEDMEDAVEAVGEVKSAFEDILAKCESEAERKSAIQLAGMKVDELVAALEVLEDELMDDH